MEKGGTFVEDGGATEAAAAAGLGAHRVFAVGGFDGKKRLASVLRWVAGIRDLGCDGWPRCSGGWPV